jgi:hypothetical protein
MPEALQGVFNNLGVGALNFIVALIILVVGYIVARIIASVVRRLLRRTNLDNRLAEALSEPGEQRAIEVEDVIARIVFWLLMLFVFVAFFERLGLMGIAEPISTFLRGVTSEYLPRLGAAALLLFVAWLAATVLKFLVKKGAALLKIDQRLTDYAALEEGERVSVGDSLATAVFWFVLLLFLPAVLNALGIASVAAPIQSVFDQVLAYVPNILGAAVILLIGLIIARIVRRIVANLLNAVGVDKFGERLGLSEERPLSDLIGLLVYTLILLVTIISALEQLNIAAISEPTTQMLTTIIDVIPNLIGATLVLVVSYAIARLVANLLKDLLSGIGLDGLPEKIGLSWSSETLPSQWVAYLVIVAIMLFAATSAAELLGSEFLVNALNAFIGFFWKVVLAVVIFAIGLYLANLAYKAIVQTGTNQANFIGRMAQAAVIVFSAAISIREVGIANEIINLAFGIGLGAIAVAVALAFGLGSTKIAEREVENLLAAMRSPSAESEPPESDAEGPAGD